LSNLRVGVGTFFAEKAVIVLLKKPWSIEALPDASPAFGGCDQAHAA
jgi:hypothetical protein